MQKHVSLGIYRVTYVIDLNLLILCVVQKEQQVAVV